jgi:hypothetical protein
VPRTCPALTLPSSGQSTASFAVCRLPLMSNVRPFEMQLVLNRSACTHASVVPGRPSARPASHRAAHSSSSPALEWAVRRTRGQRSASSARKSTAPAAVPSRARTCMAANAQASQGSAAVGNLVRSPLGIEVRITSTALRLRSTHSGEAPQVSDRRGQYQRARAASHPQWPNPSVEGTCNIRLRLLSHAPHVKR